MTTITREYAEIKSFITGFLSDPAHDNQSSDSLLANVFRIALASLEAEPVVYMWDSERKDIDAPGYYRTEHLVFAESSVKQWGGRVVPLYTAQPVPVTTDGWISCSERMPENIPGSCKEYLVFDGLNNKVHHDYWVVPDGDSAPVASFWNHYGAHVTHWMPLPEPPQEAK
ncbi:DUF551 domain-containing protein [Escherichia coli]|nr:DUF551 domain-containing protein [Escherichia coli]